MAVMQRDGSQLSSGLQILGGAKDVSQKEMVGAAGGRMAVDHEPLALLPFYASSTTSLFGTLR